MTLTIPDLIMILFYLVPELVAAAGITFVYFTLPKEDEKNLIGVTFIFIILIWAGTFNDTWGLIRAGYTLLFG